MMGFVILGLLAAFIACVILSQVWPRLEGEKKATAFGRVRCEDIADALSPCLDPDTKCDRAFEIMVNSQRSLLPVCVGERFLGFFSLDDALQMAGRNPSRTYVSAIMTPAIQVRCINSRSGLDEALRALLQSSFPQLPVVEESGELIGFVSFDSVSRAADWRVPSVSNAHFITR